MSWKVENTPEELDDLRGAKILSIRVLGPTEQGLEKDLVPYACEMISLTVMYRNDLTVNHSKVGEYEIWADAEGNGPGFVALVGNSDLGT